MLSRISSYALLGIEGYRVDVEVDISGGLVKTDIVGMGDTAVKEAKDRVSTAILNSGFSYPHSRVIVSLAPAYIKKEGTSFDLAMAIGIMYASGQIKGECEYVIIGELALGGEIRGVHGILPLIIAARARGEKKFIVPRVNALEAGYAEGIEVYSVESLSQAVEFLRGEAQILPEKPRQYAPNEKRVLRHDFKYVKGQTKAKRAIEVAVSGGHNIIMIGSAGAGKTMLSRCIPGIMPPLEYEEALEVTKLHSVAGTLDMNTGIITERPFRSPHHTATTVSLTGGGRMSKPGEVSLAHCGVLFLDEMPEYSRHTLETLRQPLEDKKITIARANQTVEYPCNFMLVASMNPCPCGNLGSPDHECRCSHAEIERYRAKLSKPLLDRIDIEVHVSGVKYDELTADIAAEPSAEIAKRVRNVRAVQAERYRSDGILCNDDMNELHLKKYCALDMESQAVLKQAFEKLGLSARAYSRVLKVARTIADMSGEETIKRGHIVEAVSYRR